MLEKNLIDKLEREAVKFINDESYDSLKDKVGDYWNKEEHLGDGELLQIEFNVLDKWVRDDGKIEVYVLIAFSICSQGIGLKQAYSLYSYHALGQF